MSLYKQKYNALTGTFNLVPTGTIVTFKAAVDSFALLPIIGNTTNDGIIVNDTGHLYIWNGSQWVDQGDIIDLKWASIEDKPSSSVADIDDAVSKKHVQNTDTILDEGGVNEVTAANVKLAVDHKDLTNNPHSVDADDVGLGNVDNTSDLNKPISTATQVALDKKYDELDAIEEPNGSTPLLLMNLNEDLVDETGNYTSGALHGTAAFNSLNSKWGNGSLSLPAQTSDYLTVEYSEDFEIFKNLTDIRTFECWVKLDTLASTIQHIIGLKAPGTYNGWSLYRSVSQLNIRYYNGSTSSINLIVSSTGLNFTNFVHILFIKQGNIYAAYYNGTQISYTVNNFIKTYGSGLCGIGIDLGVGEGMQGFVEDFKITEGNPYDLLPTSNYSVSPDTFTIPTSPLSLVVPINQLAEVKVDGTLSRSGISTVDASNAILSLNKAVISEADGDWKQVIGLAYNPVIEKFKVIYEI